MTRLIVFTDLHLLAGRSRGEALLAEIAPELESCDALVLTPAEFDQLMASSSRMAKELQRDLPWLNLSSDSAPAGTPPLSRAPDTRSGAPG